MTTMPPAIEADAALQTAADILGTTPEDAAAQLAAHQQGGEKATPPADDTQVAAKEGEETGQVDGTGTAEPDPMDAVKDYISSKYGGDPKKFMDGLYELQNTGSRQHKETVELNKRVADLIDRIEASRQAQVDPFESSVELQTLNKQAEGLTNRIASVDREQTRILSDMDKVKDSVAELRGELKNAEDFDKSRIKSEIQSKESEIRQLIKDYRSAEDKKEEFLSRKQDLDLRVKSTKDTIQHRLTIRQQQDRETAQVGDTFLTDVNNIVDSQVLAKGFTKDSKTRQTFFNYIKGEAALFWSQNPNTPIDPDEFITSRAESFFEAQAEAKTKEFVDKTKAKAAATLKTGQGKNTGLPAAAAPAPGGKLTLAQAKAHVDSILGGKR